MYSIYKLTVPNGKIYIGQTSQKPCVRWNGGSKYEQNKELYADIMEYGWRNVKKEVIAEVESKQEALEAERENIMKYQSYLPEYGYNKHKNDSTVGIKPTYKRKKGQVQCVETEELFDSAAEAANKYRVTRSAIYHAIKYGTRCSGYHWKRLEALS